MDICGECDPDACEKKFLNDRANQEILELWKKILSADSEEETGYMRNELFTIGPLTVYGYGFMIALGVIAAWIVTDYRAKRQRLDRDHAFFISDLVPAGRTVLCQKFYSGSRNGEVLCRIHIIFWIQFQMDLLCMEVLSAGFWRVVCIAICQKKQISGKYFDLVMPSVALAQGFGRIGCLLAGCCYGRETNSIFSIHFRIQILHRIMWR